MRRASLLWGSLAGGLLILTALVLWQLFVHQPTATPIAEVAGSYIQLSLPSTVQRTKDERFSAHSALLWDSASQTILYEQQAFDRLPIASITKLMTAMVALDYGFEWGDTASIEPAEYVQGGRLLLHPGETVTMRDLFTASLLGSANNATLAYVRELGISEEEFLLAMNRKAVELGLEQTFFVEVTGLDKDNVSTAYEVARMAEHAFTKYPEIAATTSQAEYKFVIQGSGREHTIRNTNKLVSDLGDQFTGSKTGYLYEARYCLVVRGGNEQQNLIAVILGSPSETEHFADIRGLLTIKK